MSGLVTIALLIIAGLTCLAAGAIVVGLVERAAGSESGAGAMLLGAMLWPLVAVSDVVTWSTEAVVHTAFALHGWALGSSPSGQPVTVAVGAPVARRWTRNPDGTTTVHLLDA